MPNLGTPFVCYDISIVDLVCCRVLGSTAAWEFLNKDSRRLLSYIKRGSASNPQVASRLSCSSLWLYMCVRVSGYGFMAVCWACVRVGYPPDDESISSYSSPDDYHGGCTYVCGCVCVWVWRLKCIYGRYHHQF